MAGIYSKQKQWLDLGQLMVTWLRFWASKTTPTTNNPIDCTTGNRYKGGGGQPLEARDLCMSLVSATGNMGLQSVCKLNMFATVTRTVPCYRRWKLFPLICAFYQGIWVVVTPSWSLLCLDWQEEISGVRNLTLLIMEGMYTCPDL